MSEVKKFVKEAIEPVEHTVSKMFRLKSQSETRGPSIFHSASEQTNMIISQGYTNTISQPYLEKAKPKIAVVEGGSVVTIRRVPNVNSVPESTVAMQAYTINS